MSEDEKGEFLSHAIIESLKKEDGWLIAAVLANVTAHLIYGGFQNMNQRKAAEVQLSETTRKIIDKLHELNNDERENLH